MPLSAKLKRRFWVVLFLFLIVYGIIFLIGDFRENFEQITQFNWIWLPVALVLVFINFALREVKWNFFRLRAGVTAPRLPSALIFFSGYSMCASPGRIGELIKPLMYKEYYNEELKKTVPLVFCERLTDLLGMVILCGATFSVFVAGITSGEQSIGGMKIGPKVLLGFLILTLLLLLGMIAVIRNRWLVTKMLVMLENRPKTAGLAEKLHRLYDSTYRLLTAYNLIAMSLFAAFSWFFECLATWLMSRYGLGIEQVSLTQVMFIFCFASIAGGLSFLPGGLGGFEAVMVLCYRLLGVATAPAGVITFLCRLATLFFGVAVGVVSILLTTRYFHEAVHWDEFEHLTEEPASELEGGEPLSPESSAGG